MKQEVANDVDTQVPTHLLSDEMIRLELLARLRSPNHPNKGTPELKQVILEIQAKSDIGIYYVDRYKRNPKGLPPVRSTLEMALDDFKTSFQRWLRSKRLKANDRQ